MALQKTHLYKVFSPSGSYLGLLQNVVPPFQYNQTIGSAFVQTQIIVQQTADISSLPSNPILDESGNNILDEAGQNILDEGSNDIVGSNNTNALIACNNQIQIYEYSQYYPNGLLVFSGYISKWKASFGAANNITITAVSNGQDLNNYLVLGGQTLDQSQLTQNNSASVNYNSKSGAVTGVGQTFTVGGGITSLSAIIAHMAAASIAAPSQYVTLNVYATPNSGIVLATSTILVSGTTAADYTFTFPQITVSAATQYFFTITSTDGSGVVVYYQNTSGSYSNGAMYRQNYGGGGGDALFHQTAFSDIAAASNLYFETFWTSAPNSVPFTNQDPAAILTTIMNSYIASGGLVSLPAGGIPSTGVLTSYTFKTQTMLQGIATLIGLAPANWYWYVDPGSNALTFAQANTVADIVLIKGRHINDLDIEATRENIKNNVYFTGGDDGSGLSRNIFVQIQAALNNNRVGLALLADNRVNSTAGGVVTARQIAQEFINDNNAETYITNVTVEDGTIDINLFKPGKVIGFAGFSPFVNNLLLQVVGINKQDDQAILQIGTLPVRTSQALANIEAALAYQQTVANPATAS